jgi:hypothetical protein
VRLRASAPSNAKCYDGTSIALSSPSDQGVSCTASSRLVSRHPAWVVQVLVV